MSDPTEARRRELVEEINSRMAARAALNKQYGEVWDTDEVTRDFEIKGFMAPFVIVVRKSDGRRGTLTFQHSPRFYFGFHPE